MMTALPPIPPEVKRISKSEGPLSFFQESLWFLQHFDPQSNAYNASYLYQFLNGTDRILLERSLNEIVRRNEIFRTVFPDRSGVPVQIIQDFVPFSIPYFDYASLSHDNQEYALKKYTSEYAGKPYDLENGPIARFAIFHFSQNEDYLFFGIHHIGFDAWSEQIFLKKLSSIYSEFQVGIELNTLESTITYLDYAFWQKDWLQDETLSVYLEHWISKLPEIPPVLNLPEKSERPALQTYEGDSSSFTIPAETAAHIKQFCRKERLTPFQFFLTVYAVLLQRYSGEDNIVIGCPFANRPKPEFENIIGAFLNTLPLRLDLSGNPGIRSLAAQIRSTMFDALTWQALPFEKLVAKLSPDRDLSRTPLYQIVINMRNVPKRQPGNDPDLYIKRIRLDHEPAQFDLSLDINEIEDTWEFVFQYNVDIFEASIIQQMVTHFQNLLGEMISQTDHTINELQMLSPAERQRIVVEWNNTARPYPDNLCVHQLIEVAAAKFPEKNAVIFKQNHLTYRQLTEKANQVARVLQSMGAGPEVPVGIILNRSAELVVAILGVLKSGSPYVPIDTNYPKQRQEYIISDSGMKILITEPNPPESGYPDGVGILHMGDPRIQSSLKSHPAVENVVTPDNLAYIIYTSGSTGVPKGVEICHKSLVNNLLATIEKTHLSSEDLTLMASSPSFDQSVLTILAPLCVGASEVVASQDEVYNVNLLKNLLNEMPISWTNVTPAAWQMLIDAGWMGKPGLKLCTGGEQMTPKLTDQLIQRSKAVYNLYGPTEATIQCLIGQLSKELPVTVGRPLANYQIYILDPGRNPVPIGVTGELFIGGVGLARGYHNLADLTNEKFIENPFDPNRSSRLYATGDLARFLEDGNIEILGRNDYQVKIHGYRIETGEIESILLDHPGVKQAVVIPREDPTGNKILVAYVIPVHGNQPDAQDLREFLSRKLPMVMIPSVFTFLEEFPLSHSGKIDRNSFPEPEMEDFGADEADDLPGDELEKKLVEIWQEVLHIQPIGVNASFFELGGQSLMAIRLFYRIEESFGIKLSLAVLFQDPTIKGLAARIRQSEGTDS
jgi:amino acid adenylation domain-containing protein